MGLIDLSVEKYDSNIINNTQHDIFLNEVGLSYFLSHIFLQSLITDEISDRSLCELILTKFADA